MDSLVGSFNNKLVELKDEIDVITDNIESNEAHSKDLKPTVNLFKELSKKRAELKKQNKEKIEQLNTISQFIEEATGEVSYGIYPLFAGSEQQQHN